jgi:hypothetical protein
MSSPFDPPKSVDSPEKNEEAFAEQVHAELARARIPQIGLGGCFGLMGGLVVLVGAGVMMTGVFVGGSAGEMAIVFGGGAFYGFLGLIYLVPAVLLIRSALALGGYIDDRREQVLAAVRLQRQFWQLLGLMFLMIFVLYGVGIVAIGVLSLGSNLESTFEEIADEIEP